MAQKRYRIERTKGKADYELPASMSREIGRIVVSWAYLEQSIQAAIWHTLELDPSLGRIAVRDSRDRLELLRDIIMLRNATWNNDLFASISQRMKLLAASRDLLAHSIWANRPDGWYVEKARGAWDKQLAPLVEAKNRQIMPELVPMQLQHLIDIKDKIAVLIEDFRSLRDSTSLVDDA